MIVAKFKEQALLKYTHYVQINLMELFIYSKDRIRTILLFDLEDLDCLKISFGSICNYFRIKKHEILFFKKSHYLLLRK